MISDEERREVARRLRGNPEDTLIPHRTGRHHGMGCREAADRFWNMCDRIKAAGNYDIAFSTTSVLADLIEPSETQVKLELKYRARCDELGAEMKRQRDALLELADDLDHAGANVENVAYIDQTFHDAARRIREAVNACEDDKAEATTRVLDVDGVEIREGETVYLTDSPTAFVVDDIMTREDGSTVVHLKGGAWNLPQYLTHERPDSWEQLEEDAGKDCCVYYGNVPWTGCDGCPAKGVEDCNPKMARDLVRRAKLLYLGSINESTA